VQRTLDNTDGAFTINNYNVPLYIGFVLCKTFMVYMGMCLP